MKEELLGSPQNRQSLDVNIRIFCKKVVHVRPRNNNEDRHQSNEGEVKGGVHEVSLWAHLDLVNGKTLEWLWVAPAGCPRQTNSTRLKPK